MLPYRHPRPGGAQWSTHWLARELVRRDHEPAILAVAGGDRVEGELGYAVFEAARVEDGLADVIAEFRPDVVVVTPHHEDGSRRTGATVAGAAPVPVLVYVHDVGGCAAAIAARGGAVAFVAVSEFVAGALGAAGGVEAEVVPPIVDRAHYRTATTRRVALFVTPIPSKGLDTVLALARSRPDVPFAFIAGDGRIMPGELSALRDEAGRLGNVEIRSRSYDPAAIYGDARVVLAPSVHPEAWGRVITEAQASGIPAIASAVGGLPDAVGAGGVLVPPEPGIDAWSAALAELWDDAETYERYAQAAEREGLRTEVTPAAVGDRFERLLLGALHGRAKPKPAVRTRS